jgi:4-hydroxy-3-polyprenylbenzoate decarboxylase
MAWALGVDAEHGSWRDLDAVAKKLMDLIPLDMPASMKGKLDALMGLKDLAGAGAKEIKKAPCQQVVLRGEEADLNQLPVLRTWPEDGGPFITLPLVVTRNLKGKHNIGMYRMQVFDSRTTGMHIHEHHDGAANMREWFEAGHDRFPISVALGGDPVTIFSATAPVPPMIDEYMFAGISRGEPVEVVKSVTNDLLVPAHAEIVIEGYVERGETRWEGPFGDHTGYYSLADYFPVSLDSGASNSSAGPTILLTRSVISQISKSGSTGVVMRLSCPRFSSSDMNSRRSLIAMQRYSSAEMVRTLG